ncbi:MAG: hypothetical protein GWO20_05995 [Candidatus Korarchaeota archaeon]|nr:hypothetical protein [Candidatus Korarchaeota archaeon]NIU82987.1 hypothetical protein [Candidatus Thorarchaeota archaeon]NIW13421.1 hypothetical protein [Candidatus Thorarchaeota archaeon]NIW51520.1 hypothetical protein [Candidatus Korarchaeota archaeon]
MDAVKGLPKLILPSEPAIIAGDSIELVTEQWWIPVYLFHRLLLFQLPLRGGIGTGKIHILRKKADESDGPVFWSAREALDQAKKRGKEVHLHYGEGTSSHDKLEGIKAFLSMGILLNMTDTQRNLAFPWVWERKKITEISEMQETLKANVSITLSRSHAYIIRRLLELEGTHPERHLR